MLLLAWLPLAVWAEFSARRTPNENPFEDLNAELAASKVSPMCLNESKTWLNSLDTFASTAALCFATKTCTANQTATLKANFYAVKQLDAFGKFPPPGFLDIDFTADGSYAECHDVSGTPYRTNYCYLLLQHGADGKCNSTFTTYARSAVCVPASCGEKDVVALFNSRAHRLFTACDTVCITQDVPKTTAFWIFSVFLMVMGVVVLASSVVDYVLIHVQDPPTNEYQTNSTLLKIFLSFSMYTNAGLLLSVKEPKKGHIRCLDCIRLFSMSWVVAGHSMMYFLMSDELGPALKLPKKLANMMFINAMYSVDTFFLLSGLVVAYLFFKDSPKASMVKNPITWVLFYVHRYIRLTPPYMLFIGFFVVYTPFINGPWSAANYMEVCKSYWWRNLIYINNFDEINNCYVISWYLAVDTQLYMVIPVLLIVLYYFVTAGLLMCLGGFVASIVATYVLIYKYDLPATNFGPDPNQQFTPKLYNMPWIRCTPYLVGTLTGYFLAKVKVDGRRIRINWAFVVAGWLAAVVIGSACVFGVYDYYNGTTWSKFTRATYYNFSRIGWALAVAWVIVANHMGWGGPINDFMSHPIWQPFGRLSYCAYIVHWVVLFYFMNLQDRPSHFISLFQIYMYYAIPTTLLSYFAAFFWSCFFEVPVLKIEKLLIHKLMVENSSGKGTVGPLEHKVADLPTTNTSTDEQNENSSSIETVYRRHVPNLNAQVQEQP